MVGYYRIVYFDLFPQLGSSFNSLIFSGVKGTLHSHRFFVSFNIPIFFVIPLEMYLLANNNNEIPIIEPYPHRGDTKVQPLYFSKRFFTI